MAKYLKNNIRYYRETMGMTQMQLGDRIGCNFSQISRYEQGEQEPPMEKLMQMADLFHITVDELMIVYLLNIIIFIPVGFLFPYYWEKVVNWVKLVLWAF